MTDSCPFHFRIRLCEHAGSIRISTDPVTSRFPRVKHRCPTVTGNGAGSPVPMHAAECRRRDRVRARARRRPCFEDPGIAAGQPEPVLGIHPAVGHEPQLLEDFVAQVMRLVEDQDRVLPGPADKAQHGLAGCCTVIPWRYRVRTYSPSHRARFSPSQTAREPIHSRAEPVTVKRGPPPPGPGCHSALANAPAKTVALGPFQLAEPMRGSTASRVRWSCPRQPWPVDSQPIRHI